MNKPHPPDRPLQSALTNVSGVATMLDSAAPVDGDDDYEVILAVVQAQSESTVTLELSPNQGCGHCHEPGGCGGRPLTQIFKPSSGNLLTLNHDFNRLPLTVGQKVSVRYKTKNINALSVRTYGVPLVFFLLGGAIGNYLGGDLSAILGAILSCALAVPLLKMLPPPAPELYISTSTASHCASSAQLM